VIRGRGRGRTGTIAGTLEGRRPWITKAVVLFDGGGAEILAIVDLRPQLSEPRQLCLRLGPRRP